MRSAVFQKTIEQLKDRDVIISFSGGKDSWVILDLAKRFSKRVEAFAMELVPGLEVFERPLRDAEQRYGINIKRYPNWTRASYLEMGTYCFEPEYVPIISLADIQRLARYEFGIADVATGTKRSDSSARRRQANALTKTPGLLAPIFDWKQRDVVSYCRTQRLPIYPGLTQYCGSISSGVGLETDTLCWLHDWHPEDFRKIEQTFPFIQAAVLRRDWYGIGPKAKPRPAAT